MGVSTPQSGTAAYMAPELLDPGGNDVSRKASAQSDIYALGMLVWEVRLACLHKCRILTKATQVHAGVHPFKGTPEYTIPLKTAKGDRPLRKDARRLVVNPDLHDDVARKNLMWEMIEGCWNNDAKRRLRLDDIRRMLKRM
jgi:serine/threonine protein kinase